MMLDGKEVATGILSTVDRLSDLPDSLLHRVITYLDTKEACRTCMLSKRWNYIWGTRFDLEFSSVDIVGISSSRIEADDRRWYERRASFEDYIHSTMQRYHNENLSIRKLTFDFPTMDVSLASKMDIWLRMAVQNHVQLLGISFMFEHHTKYRLPENVFSAKLLNTISCDRVEVPFYSTVKLASLQHLMLNRVTLEEHMLQHIINSCQLLKLLILYHCSGIKDITIPACYREFKDLYVEDSVPGTITIEANLEIFVFSGHLQWQCHFSTSSLRHLREITFLNVGITGDIFDKISPELTSTEVLEFGDCNLLERLSISSASLKTLLFEDCDELVKLEISSPNLESFTYDGDNGDSFSVCIGNTKDQCRITLDLSPDTLDNRVFTGLKKNLAPTNMRTIWEITINLYRQPKFEYDEEFTNIHCGSSLQVSKLNLRWSFGVWPLSLVSACIDGFLWSCQPKILTITFNSSEHWVAESILDILQKKADCSRHPLENVEAEDTHSSDFCKFLLTWQTVLA